MTPTKTTSDNLKTAALEFARLLVLGIPAFLVGLAINAWTNDPTFSTGVGSVVLGLLKAYDRQIHEDPSNSKTGLLPF